MTRSKKTVAGWSNEMTRDSGASIYLDISEWHAHEGCDFEDVDIAYHYEFVENVRGAWRKNPREPGKTYWRFSRVADEAALCDEVRAREAQWPRGKLVLTRRAKLYWSDLP